MKILYYSPHPTHDIVSEVGYATHQREVINALKALGHEVIPVIMGGTEKGNLSPAGRPTPKNSLKWKLKRLMPRFLWTSLKDFQLLIHDRYAAKRLEEVIIENQPDLIYERSEYLQDRSVKVVKKYKIKYFLEINAPFVEEMKSFEGYSIWHGLAHQRERNKIKHADKIFVVSSALKEFIEKRYNALPEKIFVQPNCINPDKVMVNQIEVNRLKDIYGLNGKRVIGFVGSIFPHHGVDILIDAMEGVVRERMDVVLLVVGDGSILNKLKTSVSNKNMDEIIFFTGNQSHEKVFDFISMMDICVMAKSNWYGSPIKIFEYGAMCKPVIAPNTKPLRDIMLNEETGLLVEMNKEEVAKAILKLLDNPYFAKELAKEFKNLVMKEYTWEKAASNILEAYNYSLFFITHIIKNNKRLK